MSLTLLVEGECWWWWRWDTGCGGEAVIDSCCWCCGVGIGVLVLAAAGMRVVVVVVVAELLVVGVFRMVLRKLPSPELPCFRCRIETELTVFEHPAVMRAQDRTVSSFGVHSRFLLLTLTINSPASPSLAPSLPPAPSRPSVPTL